MFSSMSGAYVGGTGPRGLRGGANALLAIRHILVPVNNNIKYAYYTVHTGRSDATECMPTVRSPFCGYNMAQCAELRGEDLSCYVNNIQSVGL